MTVWDRVLSTPKKWGGYFGPVCDFQAGYYQCKYDLQERFDHDIGDFLYCIKCGSAYPVRQLTWAKGA